MKKSFLALFAAMGLAFSANAQDAATDAEQAEASASESFNHWSAAVEGGINYLRASDQKVGLAIGGLVERTFNPRWGMGVEYMFVKKNQDAIKGRAELDAKFHDIDIFGSMNLSNIIAPYRSAGWQKLNWFATAGLGATIYNYEFENGKDDNGAKMLFLGGTKLEYNVSKWIGIFLGAQYRLHSNAEFVGNAAGRSYGTALAGVRVKFAGESNILNIAWADYIPQVELPDFSNVFDAQKKACEEAVAKLEQKVDDQNAQIKKLQGDIKFTQDSLDRHIRATRPKVAYKPTVEEAKIIETAMSNLEFESGKAIIKEGSFQYLNGLAELLVKHPEWSVKLSGHTDNVGKAAKNLQLSKDRATSVRTYLINKGVDAANIESEGFGSSKPIASNNTAAGRAKNRRVEVSLFSK